MPKTTIYVDLASENAGRSFDILTHVAPDTLEFGVDAAYNLGETGVAVVDTARASGFVNDFNHAPGCQVRGQETH